MDSAVAGAGGSLEVGGGEAGEAIGGAAGAGQGGAGVAGQENAGGAGGDAACVVEASRILIEFDSANPERVTSLRWVDSGGMTTPNVTAQGGPTTCQDPSEYFGQSYGAPEGTTPVPVIAGHLGTLARCGLDATIVSAASTCAMLPQIPVTTQYHFYGGEDASQVRVTRTIGFNASSPIYSSAGLRPYVPRVLLSALPNVIYPNQSNTAVTTIKASSCGGDCLIPTGPTWSGQWYADVDPVTGRAIIVVRDPSMTAPVSLTVNWDAYSLSNLASFVLLQPAAGWKAPITEIEYLCFADLVSWPETQRSAAQLPVGCGPP